MEDKQSQFRSKAIAGVVFWVAFLIVILGAIPETLKYISPSLAELFVATLSLLFVSLSFIVPIIISIGIMYFLIVWFRKKL